MREFDERFLISEDVRAREIDIDIRADVVKKLLRSAITTVLLEARKLIGEEKEKMIVPRDLGYDLNSKLSATQEKYYSIGYNTALTILNQIKKK
jgi:hypothetical protein